MDDRLAEAEDDDFCYLTTRGRRTGNPHEIEIWFAVEGATLYLLAGAGERSHWVRNLIAEPAVTVRVRAHTLPATALVLDEGPESEVARRLVFEKYQPRYGGSLENWRAASLPVALDVQEEPQ